MSPQITFDYDSSGAPAVTSKPILVKRYARGRLYDTARACYVTVDDLRRWQWDGVRFLVRDADTGDDVTAVLLA